AVGSHPPDLHHAVTVRIEVDVFAVRRILWAIVQARGAGQARLFAAGCGNRVNVEVAIPLGAIGEGFSIRRPAVPVRWRQRRDLPGRSTLNRYNIDARFLPDS